MVILDLTNVEPAVDTFVADDEPIDVLVDMLFIVVLVALTTKK